MKRNVQEMKAVSSRSAQSAKSTKSARSTSRTPSSEAITNQLYSDGLANLPATSRQSSVLGSRSDRLPITEDREPYTKPSKTMPMKQIPFLPKVTLRSAVSPQSSVVGSRSDRKLRTDDRKPTVWDKMKSKVEHSVLGEKVFATEGRRLAGATVGGAIAGAIIHALATKKDI